jgi:hypothetical protein
MAKSPRKIGDGEYRFDCDCGRIHLFRNVGGKLEVDTMEAPKPKKETNGEPEDTPETPKPKKPGFLTDLGL